MRANTSHFNCHEVCIKTYLWAMRIIQFESANKNQIETFSLHYNWFYISMRHNGFPCQIFQLKVFKKNFCVFPIHCNPSRPLHVNCNSSSHKKSDCLTRIGWTFSVHPIAVLARESLEKFRKFLERTSQFFVDHSVPESYW